MFGKNKSAKDDYIDNNESETDEDDVDWIIKVSIDPGTLPVNW